MKTSTLKKNNKDMKHFNLFNQDELSGRKSRSLATQQLLRRVVAILLLVLTSAGAWAARNAKVTTSVTPTGSGFAYISTSSTIGTATDATQSGRNGSVTTFTFYVKAVPAPGYTFVRWEFVNASGTTSIGSTTSAETTITARTANSDGGTRNNTIQAVFELAEEFAGFVFYSGGANGEYLANDAAGTTDFNPQNCIWLANSDGSYTNGTYYLRNNNSFLSNYYNRSTTVTLGGTENSRTGRTLRLSTQRRATDTSCALLTTEAHCLKRFTVRELRLMHSSSTVRSFRQQRAVTSSTCSLTMQIRLQSV